MAWAAQGVRRAAEEGRFPGRPRALTPDQAAAIRLLRRNGQSQSAVARTFGVSRQTEDGLARRAGGIAARAARRHAGVTVGAALSVNSASTLS